MEEKEMPAQGWSASGRKILMISADRKLFDEGSDVRRRIVEYGGLVDELHIVIFTRRKFEARSTKFLPTDATHQALQVGETNSKFQIPNSNISLYPTNSSSRWRYIADAKTIGKKILSSDSKWLVTSQDPFETGLVGRSLSRKFKISFQLQIHTDFMSKHFRGDSFLNKIRAEIAKRLIPKASCVRVVSRQIKKSLSRFDLDNITVLPIFVDIEKIQNTPVKTDLHKKYPQFDFIILMASRLSSEKNIGMAVNVMKEIVKTYPKVGLVIVGEGPEEKNLKSQISNLSDGKVGLKLQNNIILESWTDDIISYYKTADLFLLTSNYEGYGRSLIEVMASGCPLVTTDVGLVPEYIEDNYNGIVIPVGDGDLLKSAILKMMASRSMRENFALSAKNVISKLPNKEEYLAAYKKSWEDCGQN